MPPSKETIIFNTKRAVYALVITDTTEKFEHGPIKDFGPITQVQFTPTVATGTAYGRGRKVADLSILTGAEIVVDENKLPIEVRAEIYKDRYEQGVLHEKARTQPRTIAIGFELEGTEDSREFCTRFSSYWNRAENI